MPVWPKSYYTFGINLRTAGAEWKLRQTRQAERQQGRTLAALLPRLAASTHWARAGVEARMSYAQFQARVPLQTYRQLEPAIDEMKRGTAGVLWPGRCRLFAFTAGRTTGERRMLPVTEEMLAHYRRAALDAMLYYTVRARNAGVFRGRQLLLGGSPEVAPIEGFPGALGTELSGIITLSAPRWAEKHVYEPGVTVARIPDWEARIEAIVARTCARDITLIAGIPNWLLQFMRSVRDGCAAAGQPIPNLERLWPNLECIAHTGIPLAPFASELRALAGGGVILHEIYAATEGIFAAQDSEASKGLRLMADRGVFFEFLPIADFDADRIAQLGAKAVPLAGVKTGVDYALVVTTPAGLARYVVGDVVRFIATQPPRLVYVGGTTLRLHAFGENVSEKEVTDALVAVCNRHDWTLVNFHVSVIGTAPSLTGQSRGRHEWWVEIKPGTVATPIGPQIAAELDAELQRANPDYAAKRKSGAIDTPIVRLVMPGVFEHWLRYRKSWGGQHKMARCRSDREIADPLARITNFARD